MIGLCVRPECGCLTLTGSGNRGRRGFLTTGHNTTRQGRTGYNGTPSHHDNAQSTTRQPNTAHPPAQHTPPPAQHMAVQRVAHLKRNACGVGDHACDAGQATGVQRVLLRVIRQADNGGELATSRNAGLAYAAHLHRHTRTVGGLGQRPDEDSSVGAVCAYTHTAHAQRKNTQHKHRHQEGGHTGRMTPWCWHQQTHRAFVDPQPQYVLRCHQTRSIGVPSGCSDGARGRALECLRLCTKVKHHQGLLFHVPQTQCVVTCGTNKERGCM